MKTLAHEFLEIEAEDFEVPKESYDTLETILKKAREELVEVKGVPGDIILYTIAKILKEAGFRYKKNGLLSHGLQTKGLDCKHYSVLYHSIAERLGLPLKVVTAPNHAFIRWDDGNTVFDWETVSAKESTDSDYVISLNIDKRSISNGIYLRDLTREQVKAIAFLNRGIVKYNKRDLEAAILDFDKAIELNPAFPTAYFDRGNAKHAKQDPEGAIADYDKTIELDPNYAQVYVNRGTEKRKIGDLGGALADYNKAIELDPDLAEAYCGRGKVKRERGYSKRAIRKDLEMYKKLINKEEGK